MKFEMTDLYDSATVEQAVAFLFDMLKENRLGNTAQEIERIAFLSFIGTYDPVIRAPKKARDTNYDTTVAALRIVRLCAAALQKIGCLTFGQQQSPVFLGGVPKRYVPTKIEWIWAASVTEYEINWDCRPDGYVMCLAPNDLQSLLKSENGKHLCGNEQCFSRANELKRVRLSKEGQKLWQGLILEGKRAVWHEKISIYIEQVQL